MARILHARRAPLTRANADAARRPPLTRANVDAAREPTDARAPQLQDARWSAFGRAGSLLLAAHEQHPRRPAARVGRARQPGRRLPRAAVHAHLHAVEAR